jgi:hypothetical protein
MPVADQLVLVRDADRTERQFWRGRSHQFGVPKDVCVSSMTSPTSMATMPATPTLATIVRPATEAKRPTRPSTLPQLLLKNVLPDGGYQSEDGRGSTASKHLATGGDAVGHSHTMPDPQAPSGRSGAASHAKLRAVNRRDCLGWSGHLNVRRALPSEDVQE